MTTTPRAVRVPDDLWHAALAAAEANGETVSDVIRRALADYTKGHQVMRTVTIQPGLEYRVETQIGSFDVWQFGPNRIWFVADCDTDENVYRGRSFDDAMRAIAEVADETYSKKPHTSTVSGG